MKLAMVLMAAGLILPSAPTWADQINLNGAAGTQSSSETATAVQAPNISLVDPDEQIRRIRRTIAESGSSARIPGTSIPFPYAAATDPPREPYRRPIACLQYARETDGSSTCIGISDPARDSQSAAKRRVVSKPRSVEPRQHGVMQISSVAARRLTDPRYDPPPLRPMPPDSGNGLLAFLEKIFKRD